MISKQSLHWPAYIWVTGLFFLSVLVMLSFVPHTVTEALSLRIGLRLGQLSDFSKASYTILSLLYLPSALAAAITILVKRKVGWVASFVNLGISAVLLLICVANRSRELVLWQEIIAESIWFLIIAGWFIYFILARRRYSIEARQ